MIAIDPNMQDADEIDTLPARKNALTIAVEGTAVDGPIKWWDGLGAHRDAK